MGIIPKVRCRRCHREFSGLRSKCPYCGTRKAASPTTRTAATAASTVKGSASNARANQNARYQMIFGTVIMCAVVLAVIVLISTSLKGGDENKGSSAGASPAVSPSADLISPATPTPAPTGTPEPTDMVSSISFTFGGGPLAYENQFATTVGNTTQLGVNVYPLNPDAKVTWSSSDESILTEDQTGLVTALKTGWATITVSCGGVEAKCDVWVQ